MRLRMTVHSRKILKAARSGFDMNSRQRKAQKRYRKCRAERSANRFLDNLVKEDVISKSQRARAKVRVKLKVGKQLRVVSG